MAKALNKIEFLAALYTAATRIEQLPLKERTPKIAVDLLTTAKVIRGDVSGDDDMIKAALFFSKIRDLYDGGEGAKYLMFRLQEERAWASYERYMSKHDNKAA